MPPITTYTTTTTTTTTTATPTTTSISNGNDEEGESSVGSDDEPAVIPYQDYLRHLIGMGDDTNRRNRTADHRTHNSGTQIRLDWIWSQNANGTETFLNDSTTTPFSLVEESETDFNSWLFIRLILVVSVLSLIFLLAGFSYKLHSRISAARRKTRREYKSTLLINGDLVSVK